MTYEALLIGAETPLGVTGARECYVLGSWHMGESGKVRRNREGDD